MEVRALAQRSADAAKEIKALIADSALQVEQGVELVGRTGDALHGIVDKVVEVADLVSKIASTAQEQAAGLNQVNAAVGEMDNVTQQNAAMVEETTAASHRLTREAEELGQLVSRFEIGGEPGARPAPRAVSAPARVEAARPAPARPAPSRAAPPRPRADARALQSKLEENWEEF